MSRSTVPPNHDASRDRAERRASDLDEAAVMNRSGSSRPTVVFLCVQNAGRSQMAAGLMRQLARGRVDVFSGGSEPTDEVNPLAVAVMAERGIDVGAERPRPWTIETLAAADVIVTMGCGDACPVLPGKRYIDWEIDDPAGQPIEKVRAIRDEIERRVTALLADLLRNEVS